MADPKAEVVMSNARFTVLTPELIRMEWSANSKFEDHASFTFINRRVPVPKFEKVLDSSRTKLVITTSALTLSYTATGDGHFTAENLSISITVDGKPVIWHPGLSDPQNLLGTTRTLVNVGYAYWSHDIGGHMPGAVDPELYTRWVQFGTFSPILRTHTTKNPDAERRIWAYPEPYSAVLRSAFQLRHAMQPYLYTEARRTYDTGVAFFHPLYYDWAEDDPAYTSKTNTCLATHMLAAPVNYRLILYLDSRRRRFGFRKVIGSNGPLARISQGRLWSIARFPSIKSLFTSARVQLFPCSRPRASPAQSPSVLSFLTYGHWLLAHPPTTPFMKTQA